VRDLRGEIYTDYLNRGNYTGIDINQSIVEEDKWRKEGTLEETRSSMLTTILRLEGFDKTFNYLVAQYALMHLLGTYVRECFCDIRNIIKIISSNLYVEMNSHEGDSKNYSYLTEVECDCLRNSVGYLSFPRMSTPHRNKLTALLRPR